MRTTCRMFLASILLMAVVGIASAQQGGAPPPSPAPVVVTPVPAVPPVPGDPAVAPEPVVTVVPDLPAIPGTQTDPPALQPAVPASPSTPPLVQPEPLVAVPAVNPPALEKQPDSVVTTKRVTKKTVKKPAEKPATQEADSAEAAGIAVSAAAVDTTGNTPPPPGAAASTVAAASVAPPPAPLETSGVENPEGTVLKRRMGTGGWILVALAVIALFAGMTLLRRRRTRTRTRSRTSIVDHETLTPDQQSVSLLSQELKPALVPRS